MVWQLLVFQIQSTRQFSIIIVWYFLNSLYFTIQISKLNCFSGELNTWDGLATGRRWQSIQMLRRKRFLQWNELLGMDPSDSGKIRWLQYNNCLFCNCYFCFLLCFTYDSFLIIFSFAVSTRVGPEDGGQEQSLSWPHTGITALHKKCSRAQVSDAGTIAIYNL